MPAKRRGEKKLLQQTPKGDFQERIKRFSREEEAESCPLAREDYALLEKEYCAKHDFAADNLYMQIPRPGEAVERTFRRIEQTLTMTDDERQKPQHLYEPRDHVKMTTRFAEDDDEEDGETAARDENQDADIDECVMQIKSDEGRQIGRRRRFFFRPSLETVRSLGVRLLVTLVVFYSFTRGMFGWREYVLYVMVSMVANYLAERVCGY